jgi:RNA-binding protein
LRAPRARLCARKAFATFPDMTLSGRDRASLRAEAHHLTALVHIGQAGLSPTVIQSLDDTLRTHELVKVQIGKPVEMKAKDVAAALATATGAAVIQVIGKTATLYRRNPELERRKGEPPPWRTD